MKQKIHRVLSLLLCCVMLVGLLPTTAHAWEVETNCEFCGSFIADDWICDCGDHCSEESGNFECYQANHCSACGLGMGAEFICPDCGMCIDCGGECSEFLDNCGMCLKCHLDYGFACPECGKCVIDDPEEICEGCGQCYDCGGRCSEGYPHLCVECHNEDGYDYACEDCGLCFIENPDDICGACGKCYDCGGGECSEGKAHACMECHLAEGYEFACANCGQCYSPGDGGDIDESLFCPECKICWDCVDECMNCGMCVYCGIEQGKHCVCEYCFEDYPQCPDCGLCSDCLDWCGNCERHMVCAAENGDHCRNCLEVCGNENLCPVCEVCEDCSSDWCSTCEMCLECHDSDDICMECEEVCLFDDGYDHPDCHHCNSCVDEFLCAGGCGQCLICAEPDWCENCGTCIECAIADELHCPVCENCYEEYAQCEAGNDHCVEHCVICENCEECFYESESDICDECGLCLDCCEELKKAAGCTCEDAPCVFSGEDWKNHWNASHSGPHTHVYPEGYQKDEDGHWKTCIICDETVSGDHNFKDWKYLTTRAPYYGIRECKDCGYTERCCHTEWGNWQGIPCQKVVWTPTADKTQHEYACEICGNHVYHAHNLAESSENPDIHVCEDCGLEQEHAYGEWTLKIIQEPLFGRVYTGTRTCTGCKKVETCVHFHSKVKWEKIDDLTHGFTCEKCGVTFKLAHQPDKTGLVGDETGHWHVCTVCEDSVKVTPHVGKIVNKRTPTATSEGYTGDLICVLCDYFIEKGTEIPALGYGHEHQFSEEWSFGGGMHWHECTVDGCNAKEDLKAHDSSDWELVTPATEETDGLKKRVCKTCGFVDEEIIPKGHAHSFSRLWKSDDASHWHVCDCGAKAEEAAHTFKWVVDKEATATEKGSKHEECEVCGYKKAAVEIPATGTTKPTDPSDPTDPGQNPDSPETGDNSNLFLWAALLFVSGCGIFGATIYGKKKKENAE